jgi:hypothetical protein
MDRRVAQTIAGLTIALLLVACGGNSGNDSANKTATARTSDANDAATVTAFAGGRTSGGGTTTGATPGTSAGAAGKSGGFKFATLAPGGTTGSGQAAAGATPSTSRTTGSASAGNGGTPAGVSGNKYTDPQGRFTLTIPQGWQVQNTSGASVDFEATPNTLKGAFQIAAEDVGAGTTIDDYASGTMDSIKQSINNYQDVQGGIQQTTVGGLPARRFDFTGQDSATNTNLRAAVIVVEKGTTAYGFLIAADPADFDAVFAQAKQFIDSFSFLS